jgi:inhibitor of cysteine peptidase
MEVIMKILAIYSLSASLMFLLASCSTTLTKTPNQPKIILVDEKTNGGTVELLVGDQVEISLPGNATTGYVWTLDQVDKKILEPQGDPEYKVQGEGVGVGGKYIFRLKALAVGETSVEMEYRQPFGTGEIPPEKKFNILVRVAQ